MRILARDVGMHETHLIKLILALLLGSSLFGCQSAHERERVIIEEENRAISQTLEILTHRYFTLPDTVLSFCDFNDPMLVEPILGVRLVDKMRPWSPDSVTVQESDVYFGELLDFYDLADYRDSNQKARSLRKEDVLVSSLTEIEIVPQDSLFYPNENFGNIANVSFSRLAFHKDGQSAAFFMEVYCGGGCYNDQVVMIEKMNGCWYVKNIYIGGIS